EVTPEAVTLILRAIDRIRALLAEMEANGAEPAGNDAELIDEINALASGAAPVVEASVSEEMQPDMPSFSDGGFPVAAELLVEVAHALKHEPEMDLEIIQAAEPVPAASAPALPISAHPEPIREAPRESEPKETATATSSIRVNVDVI